MEIGVVVVSKEDITAEVYIQQHERMNGSRDTVTAISRSGGTRPSQQGTLELQAEPPDLGTISQFRDQS